MTGNSCLLDTSVIIHLFRRDNTIAQMLDEQSEVFVPAIVVGELHYDAYKSSNAKKTCSRLKIFFKPAV